MTTTQRHMEAQLAPPAGLWVIDPGHAEVGFVGRHLMLSRVRGRFTGVDGAITIADPLEASHVEVAIDMRSVESGDTTRDDHLRSSDLFDVDAHPTATFVGTGLTVDGSRGRLAGELTIKAMTRPVVLDVEYLGHGTDPWGGERVVFSARARINREDWGVTWNMPLDTGGLLVSREIDVEIELEAVRG